MKRTLLSVLCLAALTATAQSTDSSTDAQSATLADSYNVFALDFLQRIESEHVDENLIISPLSAQFALSMLQNGAAGHTLSEIQQALHTAGFSLDDVNAYNRALIDRLQEEPRISDWMRKEYEAIGINPLDNYSRVEIANGIWVRYDLPVYPDFYNTNATYYDASAESVDFNNPDTYAHLDQWAYDHTHGLIPSFGLKPDDPDRSMVLANTLYFKGPWSDRFYDVQPADFTNANGSKSKAELMHQHTTGWHYHTDNFVMHRLYYGTDCRFFMNLYLPKHADARLTVDEWRQLKHSEEDAIIDFYMPKFSIEDNIKLVDVLKGMGINDAFNPKTADFTAISLEPLYVSNVYQKARIEVDEEGTAAAALTVIDVEGGTAAPDEQQPPLIEIRLDRPFYFTIEDGNSILFMGHITDLGELQRKLGEQSAIEPLHVVTPPASASYDLQGRPLPPSLAGERNNGNQRRIIIKEGHKSIR